jgi:hypothetical protein
MVELSNKAAFVLVLATGIVVPGVLNYYVSAVLGQQMLGRVVWVIGYTAMVLVIWYVWLRPLDFVGPERDPEQGERKVKD